MERNNWIKLFDVYKNLLTDNEIAAFQDYYEEDLSLSEMAENKQVSRTAIHNTLKKTEEKLMEFESKMHWQQKEEMLLKAMELETKEEIKACIEKVLNQ